MFILDIIIFVMKNVRIGRIIICNIGERPTSKKGIKGICALYSQFCKYSARNSITYAIINEIVARMISLVFVKLKIHDFSLNKTAPPMYKPKIIKASMKDAVIAQEL